MKIRHTGLAAALLLLLTAIGAGRAQAGPGYEYLADARMQHTGNGIDNAYGLVHLVTDHKGRGFIRVLFSNGTELDHVQFNAQVKLLDADGRVVREEWFDRRLEAAGQLGAAEREITRLLDLEAFESMQVEFFLSDLPTDTVAGL